MKHIQHAAFRNGGALALTAAVAVALAACSGTGQPPESAPASTASTSAPTTPVAQSAAVTPFQGDIPSALTNKQCALDEINGQPAGNAGAVASGAVAIFGGWAGNGQGHAADQFVLVLKGAQNSYSAPLATGVARPDVANVLKSAGMAESGYNVAAKLSGVTVGTYPLYLANPADPTSDCDLRRTLVVQ